MLNTRSTDMLSRTSKHCLKRFLRAAMFPLDLYWIYTWIYISFEAFKTVGQSQTPYWKHSQQISIVFYKSDQMCLLFMLFITV